MSAGGRLARGRDRLQGNRKYRQRCGMNRAYASVRNIFELGDIVKHMAWISIGKGSRDGVGLIEVCVAMFIFALCISGMCSLAMTAREACDRSRDHYIAVNLAKNRLERAKSFGYSQLALFA